MRWTVADGEHYERNLTETLGRIVVLLEQPVFYDVGANYGFYTLRFAQEARWVYAFEPVTETFRILSRNIQRNRLENVTPFALGLFDKEIDVPINLYSSSGTNSIVWSLPDDHPAKLLGREMIHVARLDDVTQHEALLAPDLIKLDVEGAELPVLRGARQLIASSQPVLVVESRSEPWFDPGYSRAALLEELFRLDYVVAGLSKSYDDLDLYPFEEFEQADVVNIVAVPRRRKELLEGLGTIGTRVVR